MKILTHNDIINLGIKPIQCYEWACEMISKKNETTLPAKISMKPSEEVFYNIMPSLLPNYNVGGVKVVTRYPDRLPSLDSQILLFDYEKGKLKAILDSNYITAMRTGAVAAHSIQLFAKKDFLEVGLIGLGNQARATIKILLSLYPDRPFVFKLFKYKNHHQLFVEYIKSISNSKYITFIYCNTYEETIKNSEVVISSVTYFDKDICSNNNFMEGCLVLPIHTRGFKNCDLFFDKVYADDTKHVESFQYFTQFNYFSEVTDVLQNKNMGRESDSERIIVYNIGVSIHDIYFAEKIYRKAVNQGIGSEISLEAPSSKFWI